MCWDAMGWSLGGPEVRYRAPYGAKNSVTDVRAGKPYPQCIHIHILCTISMIGAKTKGWKQGHMSVISVCVYSTLHTTPDLKVVWLHQK